jgi:antibiotic biosynthesis monooxygenase (ABM) superfamily enzyme
MNDQGNAAADGVVKLITAAQVRPDASEQFVAWSSRVNDALQESPGYIGREVIPPQRDGIEQWVFVTQFDSPSNLARWRDSSLRARLFEEAMPLLAGGTIAEIAGNAAAQYRVENSVTEVILEQVKAGKEDAYRAWSNRIQAAQAKLPGYQGGYTQPPSPGEREWMTLMRFASVDDLNRWMTSPQREALIAEAAGLVDNAYMHHVRAAFPGWSPTDPATGQSPPNWKTTMLVLLGLYPIVCLEIAFFMGYLHALQPALGNFIGNALSVVLVAFGTMPLLVGAMKWWLFPETERARSITLAGTMLVVAAYALEVAIFRKIL